MQGLAACQFLPGRRGSSFRRQLFWNGRFGAEAVVGYGRNARKGRRSTAKPDTASRTSVFPTWSNSSREQTRFLDGDKITILEVRGTADTMTPGNTYWIKGTYTLASHDRATLAAYVTTATDAGNGTSASLKVQTTVVNRGNGTFTLFLPMSYKGWPHVSFYPADGEAGFGGNYFGTGDSVREPQANTAETPATSARKPETPTASEFPHLVRFEQGATRFADGDKITILRSARHRRSVRAGQYLPDQGNLHAGLARQGNLAGFGHHDEFRPRQGR